MFKTFQMSAGYVVLFLNASNHTNGAIMDPGNVVLSVHISHSNAMQEMSPGPTSPFFGHHLQLEMGLRTCNIQDEIFNLHFLLILIKISWQLNISYQNDSMLRSAASAPCLMKILAQRSCSFPPADEHGLVRDLT